MMRFPLLVLLLASWVSGLSAAEAHVERNVVYGMYSGLALLMDVHYPERPNGYGIVGVSGSGWSAPIGYDATPLKEGAEIRDHAARLTAAGYTIFAVNHRASPRFSYPAPLEDVQRAVRFVRVNATRYGIDGNRIGAVGGSSGGHLVSMLGVLDGKGNPDDPDPVSRASSKVQAVVAIFGAFDLRGIRTLTGGAAVALLLGAMPRPDSTPPTASELKRYAEASPITYVTPDDPPFLLFHGDADATVPFEQSRLMESALKKAGVPVRFVLVPGGRHGRNFGFELGDPQVPDYRGEGARWFDTYLRKASK